MLTPPDNIYNQSISLMGDGYIKLEVLLGTSGSTATSTTEVDGSVALTSTYKQKDYGNLEQTRAASMTWIINLLQLYRDHITISIPQSLRCLLTSFTTSILQSLCGAYYCTCHSSPKRSLHIPSSTYHLCAHWLHALMAGMLWPHVPLAWCAQPVQPLHSGLCTAHCQQRTKSGLQALC